MVDCEDRTSMDQLVGGFGTAVGSRRVRSMLDKQEEETAEYYPHQGHPDRRTATSGGRSTSTGVSGHYHRRVGSGSCGDDKDSIDTSQQHLGGSTASSTDREGVRSGESSITSGNK